MAETETAPPPHNLPTPAHGTHSGACLTQLVGVMQRLLAPDGCPWDREQTLETLVPYLIEETYEVVDALASGDARDHCEELGDLLLQIVFQAELRRRQGAFGLDDVVGGIVEKLIRRHPHVFGEVRAETSREVLANWANLKGKEKAERGKHGALEGVPSSAPALLRAARLGEKAAAVGFDFPDAQGPRAKIAEELRELDEACALGARQAMVHEVGDLLFATVNFARHLGIDAEQALAAANRRFQTRFAHMERALFARGQRLQGVPLHELELLWESAKAEEPAAETVHKEQAVSPDNRKQP